MRGKEKKAAQRQPFNAGNVVLRLKEMEVLTHTA